MHTAAVIFQTAQTFHSNLEGLTRLFGPEEAQRMAEGAVVNGFRVLH